MPKSFVAGNAPDSSAEKPAESKTDSLMRHLPCFARDLSMWNKKLLSIIAVDKLFYSITVRRNGNGRCRTGFFAANNQHDCRRHNANKYPCTEAEKDREKARRF